MTIKFQAEVKYNVCHYQQEGGGVLALVLEEQIWEVEGSPRYCINPTFPSYRWRIRFKTLNGSPYVKSELEQNLDCNLELVSSLLFLQLLNICPDNFVENKSEFLWMSNTTVGEFFYLRPIYIFQNSFQYVYVLLLFFFPSDRT